MIVHYFQVITFKQTENWKRILQDNEQIHVGLFSVNQNLEHLFQS